MQPADPAVPGRDPVSELLQPDITSCAGERPTSTEDGPGGLAEYRRGFTPRELAKVLRVSPERVRGWIQSGELRALNLASARCRKPRYVILPHHLAEFERGRRICPLAKPGPRRKRHQAMIDYYPD